MFQYLENEARHPHLTLGYPAGKLADVEVIFRHESSSQMLQSQYLLVIRMPGGRKEIVSWDNAWIQRGWWRFSVIRL